MCCNEFVFFDLQWHTRDQLCKWSYTNNEYWKSALFKFVTISHTGIFNAVRITNSTKCVWYWLSTGTVHQEIATEGYQYCTSFQRAFESLISESYTNFIVTIGCIAVATYCNSNMGFKIFDSHARDLYYSCWTTISTVIPLKYYHYNW